jgi:hypothetical protein
MGKKVEKLKRVIMALIWNSNTMTVSIADLEKAAGLEGAVKPKKRGYESVLLNGLVLTGPRELIEGLEIVHPSGTREMLIPPRKESKKVRSEIERERLEGLRAIRDAMDEKAKKNGVPQEARS